MQSFIDAVVVVISIVVIVVHQTTAFLMKLIHTPLHHAGSSRAAWSSLGGQIATTGVIPPVPPVKTLIFKQ